MVVVMVRIPVGSPEEGDRIVERFRNRAGLVDRQPGFQGFELLRDDGEIISVTRWATREDLNNWMASQANAQAHAGPPAGAQRAAAHPGPAEGEPQAAGRAAAGGNVHIYEVVIPEGGRG